MELPLRAASVSDAGAAGTPYAGGAQERERSEPRLASDTSYITKTVLVIHMRGICINKLRISGLP